MHGKIVVQTSKNAVLPIISASLLADEGDVELVNCPQITDVSNMLAIMRKLNVKVSKHGKNYVLNPSQASNSKIDCRLIKSMRSSIFLLGSTLSRFKTTTISLPGGCKIGARPIDIHINSLKSLGVEVKTFGDQLFFDATHAHAGSVELKLPSVGATENLVQFACKLPGKTTIINAAREPEVVDLCHFLNAMGAKIVGAGGKKITIYGQANLKGVKYKPIGDRIVAGTIMIAVAICGGKVSLENVEPSHNKKLIEILCRIGCKIDTKNDILTISKQNSLMPFNRISTGFYPAFPTDLQSQMLALSIFLPAKNRVKEIVFENRFLIASELEKLGAEIKYLSQNEVEISAQNLAAVSLIARDLRGGASLVLASLGIKGQSEVSSVHYIDRGYESLEKMFAKLGADIKRE